MNRRSSYEEDAAQATISISGQLAGKYLTFTLQEESFGLAVLKVREIIRSTHFTPIPQMPTHVRGVINLRGKIIPVIDLRQRFGLVKTADTELTCIIVVQVQSASATNAAMGLIVDGVEDVVNIAAEDIEERPEFGAQAALDFVLGMAKVKGKVKTLLDIDRVIAMAPPIEPTL